jgi:hypothetical protein
MTRKEQVKPGTPQRNQEEAGNPKKQKEIRKPTKTFLKGAQPTIKQLIGVRQTRKLTKASQGGHPPPKVINEVNLLEL